MTLDLIAKVPSAANELSRERCLDLLAQCAAAHAALLMRFVTIPSTAAEPDAIDAETAARLLGIARKTLANGAPTRYRSLRLPSLTRRLVFSRKAVLALQADHRGLVLGTVGPHLLRAPGRKRPRRGGPAPSPLRHGEGGAV